MSLATMPLSLAVLRLTSMNGAPLSKIKRYGPLPLIFTRTAMCLLCSSSNGTELGSAAHTGAARARRVRPIKALTCMSQPLPGLDGEFLYRVLALDLQPHGF